MGHVFLRFGGLGCKNWSAPKWIPNLEWVHFLFFGPWLQAHSLLIVEGVLVNLAE